MNRQVNRVNHAIRGVLSAIIDFTENVVRKGRSRIVAQADACASYPGLCIA